MERGAFPIGFLLAFLLLAARPGGIQAAGLLTPAGAQHAPLQIRDHQVEAVIQNGFAVTEVIQTFHNPNDQPLEALYSFPLPKSASLSEVTVYVGEREIQGEVLPRKQAGEVYEEEKEAGRSAALARKEGFISFEFLVANVGPGEDVRVRFLYYQPLAIDTGVGRYLYPLEEGGTDEAGASFWTRNDKVEGTFAFRLELHSAYPVSDVRLPGHEADAKIEKKGDGKYSVELEKQGSTLGRDLLFYYRLADELPGRVDLLAYRKDRESPGTFLLVLTPGLDLKPLARGADYLFVLDVSGSMAGKIATLARGVVKALGQLAPEDRFRIVTFNSRASELTSGWVAATKDGVERYSQAVAGLRTDRNTNLYDGLRLALSSLDSDRATSLILVTDAVANTGEVAPAAFEKLMSQYDLRVFGFLMGNSANWPLMRAICDATGGFYAAVSNEDDIIGQILLAKGKVTHECLHHAKLTVSGVKVFDATDENIGKVYRGEQLAVFGRYAEPGRAEVRLEGRLTGEDKVYATAVELPEVDTDYPELERLWALERIEDLQHLADVGRLDRGEAVEAVSDLGVAYQLVTDETSMLVLDDESFARRGIERQNRDRTAGEHKARARRSARELVSIDAPPRRAAGAERADGEQPMFSHRAPSTGGGALDPVSVAVALALAASGLAARRRKRHPTGTGEEEQ